MRLNQIRSCSKFTFELKNHITNNCFGVRFSLYSQQSHDLFNPIGIGLLMHFLLLIALCAFYFALATKYIFIFIFIFFARILFCICYLFVYVHSIEYFHSIDNNYQKRMRESECVFFCEKKVNVRKDCLQIVKFPYVHNVH